MDKFISLLGIEYQIAAIYKNLFNVESNVTMDNLNDLYVLFDALIKKLDKLLDSEEKILLSLTNDDLATINVIFEKGTVVNLDRNDPFTRLANERIDFRINGNNPKLDRDKSSVILNYIIDDFDNYYLSFIEEWLRKEKNKTIKEYLFLKKYQYLFLISRRLEKDKIKDNFATEDSVYASSYFISQYYNISDEKYNDIKKKYAISKTISSLNNITKLMNNYDDNEEKRFIFDTKFKLCTYSLRSALILLGDNERKIVLDKIYEKAPFLVESINNIFDKDFDDIINSDRERHKTLSLKIKK